MNTRKQYKQLHIKHFPTQWSLKIVLLSPDVKFVNNVQKTRSIVTYIITFLHITATDLQSIIIKITQVVGFTILRTRCSTVFSDSVNTSHRTQSCPNYDDQSRCEITHELSVTHKKDTGLDSRDRTSYFLQQKHTAPMKIRLCHCRT